MKCLIYPFDRDSQDGAFTYRENLNLNPRDVSIIYPFLQRGNAQMSQVFTKESALQSLLRRTNTRSVSFFQNRDLFLNLLTKNSEIIVPHRRSTVILFKGDTTFHKGGNVVSEPRYSIQLLFKIV